MTSRALLSMGLAASVAAFTFGAEAFTLEEGDRRALRVCADPNNLPFSNKRGEGFENKIAEILAEELDAELSYYWHAQRRGFIRKTLKANKCDLVIGVPAGYEMAQTTAPYYRSSYVWVYPEAKAYNLHSITDPRLKTLRIGVHLIGDDGSNSPPAHALGAQGIVDNVSGYLIYGDYREENPPARLVEAAAKGDVDVAAVWGPLGGYFAKRLRPPLHTAPITGGERFAPLKFQFAIAMGVRRGEDAFQAEIERAIDRRREDIRATLRSYGVPLVEEDGGAL